RAIAELVDGSPVTFPAYEGTNVSIRKRKADDMPEERAMSVEEIVAALEEIMAKAKDEESGEDRPLTEEEQARYTELERQLELARKSEEIRSRHEAARKVERPMVARTEEVNERDNEFRNYLVNPETRGHVIGTPSAGGYAVPESWANELVRQIETYGGLAS